MWGINQPNNEWFIGQYYKLETDEEILLELPEDYDEQGYVLFPIEFRYKQFVDEKGVVYPIRGLRGSGVTYTIETSAEFIEFKNKDKIILMTDEKAHKITNVSTIKQTSKTMATFILPGLHDVYNNNRKVITLQ